MSATPANVRDAGAGDPARPDGSTVRSGGVRGVGASGGTPIGGPEAASGQAAWVPWAQAAWVPWAQA